MPRYIPPLLPTLLRSAATTFEGLFFYASYSAGCLDAAGAYSLHSPDQIVEDGEGEEGEEGELLAKIVA